MSLLKNVYVFIGPPGSGKGSLSSLCVNQLGWGQLSTGNLCRKHILEQTEIGKQIDFAMKSGKLVSDSLISSLVDEWFAGVMTQVEAVILDGYPRTTVQAKALHESMQQNRQSLQVKVIKFYLNDKIIMDRLGARYTCTNRDCQAVYSLIENSSLAPKKANVCDRCSSPLGKRSDDNTQVIQERLAMYHKHEQDLLDFYKSHGYPIIEFDVDKTLDAVFDEFKQILNRSIS